MTTSSPASASRANASEIAPNAPCVIAMSSGSKSSPSSARRPAATTSCALRSLVLYANQSTDCGSSWARIAAGSPGRAISCGLPNVKSSASGSSASAWIRAKNVVTMSTAAFASVARADITMAITLVPSAGYVTSSA